MQPISSPQIFLIGKFSPKYGAWNQGSDLEVILQGLHHLSHPLGLFLKTSSTSRKLLVITRNIHILYGYIVQLVFLSSSYNYINNGFELDGLDNA